jgi:hypothetical protein
LAGCIILPAGKAWSLCPDSTVLKRPFFGDLHVHTSYSLDAYARGARNDPWDAYRFAKKDTLVGLTPNQGDTLHPIASQSVEIDRALDFTGVTDHAEYLSIDSTQPCSYLNRDCSRDTLEAWERNIRAAREANDPCRFTSFIAYEYTLGDRGTGPKGMRHRNVIFANDSVPALPAHALDYPTPGSLWARLYATCLNAGTGCDVLAIAHNPNYSKASMFETETEASRPFTAAEAAVRARMEPLVEMIQHKGASECMVGVGNNDEECAFEYDDGRGSGPKPEVVGTHYIREGLKRGLQELGRINVNPFKLGFIGSTDTHNGTPGAVSESRWKGHAGDADATPDSLLSSPAGTNPGGLAVIWAEENTREALFRAMRRRETYATSGPRMIVRMFGGWDWPANVCSAPNPASWSRRRWIRTRCPGPGHCCKRSRSSRGGWTPRVRSMNGCSWWRAKRITGPRWIFPIAIREGRGKPNSAPRGPTPPSRRISRRSTTRGCSRTPRAIGAASWPMPAGYGTRPPWRTQSGKELGLRPSGTILWREKGSGSNGPDPGKGHLRPARFSLRPGKSRSSSGVSRIRPISGCWTRKGGS